jgi:NADH dehydrogenase
VDYEGNRNLIAAARAAGVERFILISMHGAAPDHPMELLRMKYRAEEELKASGPAWTIIRPTVSMETWAQAVGEPLLRSGKTRVFGRGVNPINFVAWSDVARFVELAVADRAMRGMAVDVGGPENLTMNEFVATFQRATGTDGAVSHVPLPIMRLMAVLMRPVNAALARQIEAGVLMDTRDMTLDASPTARRFPSIPQTTVAEMVRRVYAAAA